MYNAEQRAIIDASLTGANVAVNAGPGCGKSYTLNGIARHKPNEKIVNFCFNRSTKLQADERMPAWVKNFTFHGAAYGQVGKYYARKLNVKLSPKAIAKKFDCDERLAMIAKYTLRKFALSDDNAILGYHVPFQAVMAQAANDREAFKEEVVMIARKTWLAAMDFKNTDIGVEHDFYLKKWVLEGAKLNGRYDVVMVDEAQDMVPVNINALRKIYGQQVVVGDVIQQLYEWRNAVNSFDVMDFDQKLFITKSNRFGAAIAELANKVIDIYPEDYPHLIGSEAINSTLHEGMPTEKYTMLCRSNAGLLGEALKAIRQGKQIHVVGSLMDAVLLMESAWYLSIGEMKKVRHPTMLMAGTWENVLEMAKEDQDFKMAVNRVKEYGGGIPYFCEELKMAGETSRERADVILSTVHKAKGDEFDVVKLGDDFPDLVQWRNNKREYVPMKAEICVAFVAITRAKQKLYANNMCSQLSTWKELL